MPCFCLRFVRLAPAILLLTAFQSISGNAQPFDETKFPIVDETVSKIIEPPPAAKSTDEYLISLAKAGDVNFIADVTSDDNEPVAAFPASPGAQHNKWQPKFELVMLDFTQERRFSLLRYNPDTFLFWREPDAIAIARGLSASIPIPAGQKPAPPSALYEALVNSGAVPKDFELTGEEADIRINELPIREQERIMQMIRLLILERNRMSWAWFRDDFWKSAFVRLVPMQVDGKNTSALQIAGFYLGQSTGVIIRGLHQP